jgi:predicted dehydrogenase
LNIVILGAAHWHASCYYAPAMKRGDQVTLIDEDVEPARAKAERNGLRWSADYAALDEIRPDFAYCLGRHDRMSDLTAMCVERRIPFMAEKPGAKNAQTLFTLSRRCEEMKLFNSSPFNYRFDNTVRRVKSLIDSGELGRVSRIYCSYFGGARKRYAVLCWPWRHEK